MKKIRTALYACRSCGKKYSYLKCLRNHFAKAQHAPIWVTYYETNELEFLKRELMDLKEDVRKLKEGGLIVENFSSSLPIIQIKKTKKDAQKSKQNVELTIVIKEMNLFFSEIRKVASEIDEHAVKPSELIKLQSEKELT